VESRSETTSPGVFVALAAPSEADEGSEPLIPRGALVYGGGVGLLLAIGIGTFYFVGFRGQDIEWAKLSVHLLAYCMATMALISIMLDRTLARESDSWLASAKQAARGGAIASALPGALAVGHFARLRLDFIGVWPLAVAALTAASLLALRSACRRRGARGYFRAVGQATCITFLAGVTLVLLYAALAAVLAWPDEYEVARMIMVADLRNANLLDAFYYAVGAAAGAIGGAVIGAFVGLWGLGRAATTS
jgi:hypothetical protein